jgi:hypothetical protein
MSARALRGDPRDNFGEGRLSAAWPPLQPQVQREAAGREWMAFRRVLTSSSPQRFNAEPKRFCSWWSACMSLRDLYRDLGDSRRVEDLGDVPLLSNPYMWWIAHLNGTAMFASQPSRRLCGTREHEFECGSSCS